MTLQQFAALVAKMREAQTTIGRSCGGNFTGNEIVKK